MEDKSVITKNKKYSLSLLFLSLFTVTNYFTPKYYLGDNFAHLPFYFAVLALISILITNSKNKQKLLIFNKTNILLLIVYFFCFVFTYVITVDHEHSLEIFTTFSKAVILYFLISHILTDFFKYKAYLFILIFCSFGIAFKLVHYPIWHGGRAWLEGSSLVKDPNDLTALFVYSLPINVALFLITRNKWLKIILIYTVFMLLLGIIEAQSRGGFVALAVSILVFIKQIEKKRQRRLIALLLIIIIPLFFLRYATPAYKNRIIEIFAPETDPTGSAQHRKRAMKLTFQYTLHHPFSEYGVGNHSYYLVEQIHPDLLHDSSVNIFRGSYLVHNLFLQFGADTGLIPLLVYISFVISLFSNLRIHQDRHNIIINNRDYIITLKALRVALYGFLAGAFFLPWAYRFYLFYIGGLIAALNNIGLSMLLRVDIKSQPVE